MQLVPKALSKSDGTNTQVYKYTIIQHLKQKKRICTCSLCPKQSKPKYKNTKYKFTVRYKCKRFEAKDWKLHRQLVPKALSNQGECRKGASTSTKSIYQVDRHQCTRLGTGITSTTGIIQCTSTLPLSQSTK